MSKLSKVRIESITVLHTIVPYSHLPESQYSPFNGETLLLDNTIPTLLGAELVADVEDRLLLPIDLLGQHRPQSSISSISLQEKRYREVRANQERTAKKAHFNPQKRHPALLRPADRIHNKLLIVC